MFRGREVFHPELGKRILDRVAETIGEGAKVEADARLDGRNMTMVLAPDKRRPPRTEAAAPSSNGASAPSRPTEPAPSEPAAPSEPVATEAPDTGHEHDRGSMRCRR